MLAISLVYHFRHMQYAISFLYLICMIDIRLHVGCPSRYSSVNERTKCGVRCDNDNHVTFNFFSARHNLSNNHYIPFSFPK